MRLTVDVTGEATGLRRICKDDALTNRAGKHWRIVIRQRLGGVPGDDGARAAAVEQEAGDKFRPYYTHVYSYMSVLMQQTGDSELLLRARAMECVGLMNLAVGRAHCDPVLLQRMA